MKKLAFYILGILLLAVNSCDEVLPTSDYAEFFGDKWISTEVNFMPQEVSDGMQIQVPSLSIVLRSVEIFGCLNFIISTTEFINDDELIIRFDEIDQTGGCLTSPGPATALIELPENINKLTFLNGNVVDQYAVDINQEKVSITLISSSLTHSLYDETFRYPVNSFAYVCGTDTNNTNIYDDFLGILQQNPALVEIEFQGSGRIPFPVVSNGSPVNHSAKYFKYAISSDYAVLENTLDSYAAQNIPLNSGTRIALYGWNRWNHFSWD